MAIRHSTIIAAVLFFLAVFLTVNFCFAADPSLKDAFKVPLETAAVGGAGYSSSLTTDKFISLIITTALSFIGVIFLILAIYGGYVWMTARGNEELVKKAQDTIIAAVIGLAIVLAAYAISWYVINALGEASLQPTVTPL